MEYLLFAGFLVLFAWLVTRTPFYLQAGLTRAQLVILLLLKIMAGIFYGWIGIYYGQFAYMFDTWGYHYNSIDEYNLLLDSPGAFLSNIFHSGYDSGYHGFFSSQNSYWNDLKSNFFVSILALFNLLSSGNYYVNVIFYSFITLAGPIAFFRVLSDVFPGRKWIVLLATIGIPSFLYWTSGIHKDGLVFMALALIVYHVYFGMKKGWNWKRWVVIFISILLLLTLRNFILVLLLPALVAWWLAEKFPTRRWLVFPAVYLVAAVLFFTLRYIHPGLDFPRAVAQKQQAFEQLQGGSAIPLKDLEPDFQSFLENSPQALASTMLRPHAGDVRHILSLAAATETSFLLLLFLCFIFFHRNSVHSRSYLWFSVFFAFSFLLTIGYTVNFLGAIVRYRSIMIPFLLVPVVSLTNWKRIGELIFSNNITEKNNV